MGIQGSKDAQGAVKFEDQFEVEKYITEDFDEHNVVRVREAFESLAEQTPDGELAVNIATLQNIEPTRIQQSIRKSRPIEVDEEEDNKDFRFHKNERNFSPRQIITKPESSSVGAGLNCNWAPTDRDEHFEEINTPPKVKYLNFDQFFELMKDKIKNEQNSLGKGDIIFESESSNVSCLFWPY